MLVISFVLPNLSIQHVVVNIDVRNFLDEFLFHLIFDFVMLFLDLSNQLFTFFSRTRTKTQPLPIPQLPHPPNPFINAFVPQL